MNLAAVVCRVVGHRWIGVGQIDRRCVRCGRTETFS
jgi:hypothetical protein